MHVACDVCLQIYPQILTSNRPTDLFTPFPQSEKRQTKRTNLPHFDNPLKNGEVQGAENIST